MKQDQFTYGALMQGTSPSPGAEVVVKLNHASTSGAEKLSNWIN